MSSNTEHAALMEAQQVFRAAVARYMKYRRPELLLGCSDSTLAHFGISRSEADEATRGLVQPIEVSEEGEP